MKRWLERSGRWFPTLRRIAREEEMPEEIIYLAMMESGLNPNAQSWAKAVGMWQFIASTGEMYDLKITPWVDERRDPEKATRAAMRFLKDLYNDLGDWHLALAAYNCGPGGVRRAKRRAGMPDGNYWDIRNHLPRETRNYVPLYIATTLVTMNPDNYDFPPDSLQFHSPHLYDTFLVPEAVNISALAQCAGISVDSLKLLNPELIRPCTPPNETYRLKIPVGTREMVTRNFAQLTTEEKQPWVTHTVRKRETLAAVSRLYGVSVADLAAINGISGYKSRLRVGSKLRVPVQSAEEQTENNTEQIAPPAASQVAQKSEPTKPNVRTHIVAEGESLTTIARKFGVTVADLQSWNNIARQNETILPGDQLVVGYTDQPSENLKVERIRVQKVVTHKVKRGETLAELANRYGTTVAEIRSLNKMKRNQNLRYGTSIKVETSVVTTRMVAGQKSNSTPASAPPQTYTVQKGDTISSICARTGISVASLRELNPSLKKSDVVRIGQRLRLQ